MLTTLLIIREKALIFASNFLLMFFKTHSRIHPHTGRLSIYYRLVENSRNAIGGVHQRSIMAVGFMEDVSTEELHRIADGLNNRISGQGTLFEENPKAQEYIEHLYARLVKEKRIDRVLDSRKGLSQCDWQRIDMNSIENRDVRELGAEWVCLQTLYRLQIDRYLDSRGWSAEDCNLALAHIVCRTVYPASELKTLRYMQENSSICELLGLEAGSITKDKLYGITHRLYNEKDGLECHLSLKTNELFDLEDRIILYDLTNTYFEGEKRHSVLARHGRSKEKRSDCPLVVLALVVNVEGFIKYSAIYEGNMADCKTLGAMIEKLVSSTTAPPLVSSDKNRRIVVIDAGIATEENLKSITDKGYDYVCVSRSSMKAYITVEGTSSVTVLDHRKRPIELVQVHSLEATDNTYYMKVTSPAKALKETSMNTLFCSRYEEGLALIAKGVTSKGGTKRYDSVNRRIGRLVQKYPSVHPLYDIHIGKDKEDICTSMTWEKKAQAAQNRENTYGVYFLRTSINEANEKLVWRVYNCIREIEKSIRTLKTDLDLRPIFHKNDAACQAHIHLGLMAYWVVNTVRHQLRDKGITSDWRELIRVMNTQKCITTSVTNDKGQIISVRCCSKPEHKAARLYEALKMKPAPFIRKKSVVLKIEPITTLKSHFQIDTS